MGAEMALRFASGAVSAKFCGWSASGAEASELLAKAEAEEPLAEMAGAAVFSVLSEDCRTGDRVR